MAATSALCHAARALRKLPELEAPNPHRYSTMQLNVKSALTVVFALLHSATQAQPNRVPAAVSVSVSVSVSDPKTAFEDARKVAQSGTVDVPLAGQAVLNKACSGGRVEQAVLQLPTGFVFIAQPQATQLLRAMGNLDKTRSCLGRFFPKPPTTMPVPKPIGSSPFGLKPLATSKTTTRATATQTAC